jgi:hypothetical protein
LPSASNNPAFTAACDISVVGDPAANNKLIGPNPIRC